MADKIRVWTEEEREKIRSKRNSGAVAANAETARKAYATATCILSSLGLNDPMELRLLGIDKESSILRTMGTTAELELGETVLRLLAETGEFRDVEADNLLEQLRKGKINKAYGSIFGVALSYIKTREILGYK